MKYLRTMLAASLFSLSMLVALPASAQNTTTCTSLRHPFSQGATDSTTGGDVTKLQVFLSEHGYLPSDAVIGIFGPRTRAAVAAFQKSQGLYAVGYVGTLTENKIYSLTCGRPVAQIAPTITSLSPVQAPVGTKVTVTGANFAETNTVHFGYGGIRNVTSTDGVHLTFTVPTALGPLCPLGQPCPYYARLLTPGDYAVSIENENGTSNAVTFTIGTSVRDGDISLIQTLAPRTLGADQIGTWDITVATSPNVNGVLSYTARWDDDTSTTEPVVGPSASTSTPAKIIFTHAYTMSAQHFPLFTISDAMGHVLRIVSPVTVAS